MSKTKLSGCKPHWQNLGKSGVIFPFLSPTTLKPEHAVPTLEINGRSYFDLLQIITKDPTMEPLEAIRVHNLKLYSILYLSR